jgi:hypothetical protein
VVALPRSEYFDDQCTDDARSALGTYVARHFSGQATAFSALIQSQCRSKFGCGVPEQKTCDEAAESFGAGRAILLVKPFGIDPPMAFVGLVLAQAEAARCGGERQPELPLRTVPGPES